MGLLFKYRPAKGRARVETHYPDRDRIFLQDRPPGAAANLRVECGVAPPLPRGGVDARERVVRPSTALHQSGTSGAHRDGSPRGAAAVRGPDRDVVPRRGTSARHDPRDREPQTNAEAAHAAEDAPVTSSGTPPARGEVLESLPLVFRPPGVVGARDFERWKPGRHCGNMGRIN